MVKTSLVALLLVVLLAAQADCWRRRSFRFRGRAIINRVVIPAAKKYVIQKAATAAVVAVGKRDVTSCLDLTAEQLDQLAADLGQACAALDKDASVVGVSQQDVLDAFLASDDNGDGLLFTTELDEFASTIQLIDDCASVEAAADAE